MYGKRSSHLQKIHPCHAGKNILRSPPAPCQFDGLCSLLRNLSHSGYFRLTSSSQYPLFLLGIPGFSTLIGCIRCGQARHSLQEARSGIRRVLIIVPSPLLGHQSPDKAVSSRLTLASGAAASKGPCQAALLTPTPRAVLLKGALQPREHLPWKMKHYGRWTQTSACENFCWAVFHLKCWMQQHIVAEGCTTGRWREKSLDLGTSWLQGVSP